TGNDDPTHCGYAAPDGMACGISTDARSAVRRVLLDERDRVLDGLDLFGGVVRNFASELFLERHDQLDRIEAVSAQIVDEAGAFVDLRLIDAQMLDDDLFHPIGDVAHVDSILRNWLCRLRSNFGFRSP